MSFVQELDHQVLLSGLLDLELAHLAVIGVALMAIKLVPQILGVSLAWLVVLAAVAAIRLLGRAFVRGRASDCGIMGGGGPCGSKGRARAPSSRASPARLDPRGQRPHTRDGSAVLTVHDAGDRRSPRLPRP